eukprot:scaffold36167_cov51-Attheya_sp.AAC.1
MATATATGPEEARGRFTVALPQVVEWLSQKDDYEKAAALCLDLLLQQQQQQQQSDNEDATDDATAIRATLGQTHLTCLLALEQFPKVVSYCKTLDKNSNNSNNKSSRIKNQQQEYVTDAHAYALYRLGQYRACLQVCQASSSCASFAQKHVKAQALYRLHQTTKCVQVYDSLLLDQQQEQQEEELEEVWTNALAARVANWTRGNTQDEDAALLSTDETPLWEDDYDLAYNYATWLLLFQKNSKEALAMLEQAETTCRHSNEDDHVELELELELSPILLHQAMCHFGLHTNKDNENKDTAKKLYLGQALLKSSAPQCVAVAKANLAVCSKTTMAQVTLAHLDLPPPLDTDTNRNTKTVFQHSPYTPVQQRHVVYNRALVYLAQASTSKGTKAAGAAKACRAALADLQTRLLGVSHPKKTHAAVAPATDDVATQLWINRSAMVESELLRVVEHNPKAAYQLLTTCLEQTSTKSSSASSSSGKKEAWKMVRAELLLYRHVQQQQSQPQQNDDGDDDDDDSKAPIPVTKEDTIALLECAQDIPQRPGTLATIASLYRELGDVERATAVLQSSIMKDNHPLALAHSKYEAGLYQEAADLYESCLNSCRNDASRDDTDKDADAAAQDVGLVTAHLIQALSHVDPNRALSYTLPEAHPTMEDGAALEALEIPRLSGSTTMTTTTMNGTGGGSNKALTKTSKKEAVMEQRAKRREAHVKSLPPAEQERTPDPERWIPKAQRSHHKNRRGRNKGRYQSNNATTTTQGGGSGAGADRNAAKLDVAARKKDGGTSTTGPSTANMRVTPSAAGTKRKGKGRR